jgi:hypothetical protein
MNAVTPFSKSGTEIDFKGLRGPIIEIESSRRNLGLRRHDGSGRYDGHGALVCIAGALPEQVLHQLGWK